MSDPTIDPYRDLFDRAQEAVLAANAARRSAGFALVSLVISVITLAVSIGAATECLR